jgi:hypothetical protein
MPVTTTIARHYAWRCLIIIAVCLALGLWGVYDYIYSIPAKQRQFARAEVLRLVLDALDPERWDAAVADARKAVNAEIEGLEREHYRPTSSADYVDDDFSEEAQAARVADLQAAVESIRDRQEGPWFLALMIFRDALQGPRPQSPLTGTQLQAREAAEQGLQAVASVSRPAAYDRPMQWMFIACLPFVPYYLWMYFATRARVYRLDEDGTLHLPGAVWKQDEVVDIDMDRWMAKSIAHVVHRDGRRMKLDDYKHRNLHLIVGALASRMYPEKWTVDARPVVHQVAEAESEPDLDAEPATVE